MLVTPDYRKHLMECTCGSYKQNSCRSMIRWHVQPTQHVHFFFCACTLRVPDLLPFCPQYCGVCWLQLHQWAAVMLLFLREPCCEWVSSSCESWTKVCTLLKQLPAEKQCHQACSATTTCSGFIYILYMKEGERALVGLYNVGVRACLYVSLFFYQVHNSAQLQSVSFSIMVEILLFCGFARWALFLQAQRLFSLSSVVSLACAVRPPSSGSIDGWVPHLTFKTVFVDEVPSDLSFPHLCWQNLGATLHICGTSNSVGAAHRKSCAALLLVWPFLLC